MTDEEKKIRREFPLFAENDTIYLDNAATTQRPQAVLDAMEGFYKNCNSNPLRGLYALSLQATDAYEQARVKVAEFIGAPSSREIIFTRNATEGLNLVSYSYAMNTLSEGDEIIVSIAEHHSNMLPWQQAAKHTGAVLKYFYCEPDGSFDPEKFQELLSPRTRIVAMTQMSNIFGRTNDIAQFAKMAHEAGSIFVCDGAQSVPHMAVNVADLDVDFFAFSGHKMFGPMGIGVLYGKEKLLDEMPPFLFGGEMIETVTTEGATYAELPHKFEAGTVNAAGAVGLAAAIDFIMEQGRDRIYDRERRLSEYAYQKLSEVPYVKLFGSEDPADHHGIFTFRLEGVHPHDVAYICDASKIAVRAGHHCAQPLLKYLGTLSTSRASLTYYNTFEEIDRLCECLSQMRKEMGYAE